VAAGCCLQHASTYLTVCQQAGEKEFLSAGKTGSVPQQACALSITSAFVPPMRCVHQGQTSQLHPNCSNTHSHIHTLHDTCACRYTGTRPWAGLTHGQIIVTVASKAKRLVFPQETPEAFASLANVSA
jgi:hypothetical protein